MKKLEIYKEDDLLLSILVEDYQIDTYTNQVEIHCKIKDIETSYSMPINKGYKIVADI